MSIDLVFSAMSLLVFVKSRWLNQFKNSLDYLSLITNILEYSHLFPVYDSTQSGYNYVMSAGLLCKRTLNFIACMYVNKLTFFSSKTTVG